MKGRIKFDAKNRFISMDHDWPELVDKPFSNGMIIEAFANADALLDFYLESCLREVYNSAESQDLINEIHLIRSRVHFDGSNILEILYSKKIILDDVYQNIKQFKKARNLVVHSQEAEYALVLGNPKFQYSSQEELDNLVSEESKKAIELAYKIFEKIIEILKQLNKSENKGYYLSEEFYRKNPRGQTQKYKEKFPNLDITTKKRAGSSEPASEINQ